MRRRMKIGSSPASSMRASQGRVRVAGAHGLDEGGDHVVVLFAPLVIPERLLLQHPLDRLQEISFSRTRPAAMLQPGFPRSNFLINCSFSVYSSRTFTATKRLGFNP